MHLKIGHQGSSPGKGRQGGIPYCMFPSCISDLTLSAPSIQTTDNMIIDLKLNTGRKEPIA